MIEIDCRAGCGACCIAPSISSPIPGMPNGKPAGARCIHLGDDHRCGLWGSPDRPEVCNRLRASVEMCGVTGEAAYRYLARLERLTRPV